MYSGNEPPDLTPDFSGFRVFANRHDLCVLSVIAGEGDDHVKFSKTNADTLMPFSRARRVIAGEGAVQRNGKSDRPDGEPRIAIR